jgi:1-deoxy-D-xylulose-5-phosphate reductoisomerase
MQYLTILGSTGSIGVSTLDVVARHPSRYGVYALTAHSRVDELLKQCIQFLPRVVVVSNAVYAKQLFDALKERKLMIEVLYGEAALVSVASSSECDVVMAAIVGAAGLAPALAAARAGKKILLANKEALVMSGSIFMQAVQEGGATLLPIDSEHNAIFQCLPATFNGELSKQGIEKIILTASGGPFLYRSVETLNQVTPEEAVAHPNWVMGRKISVDSATMMNKGLEVIEAHYLFQAKAQQIEVLIHPQSVVHSMVSYTDGSVLAQLGNPDMRTPIAHALAYPERISSGVAALDLTKMGALTFEEPNVDRFPCLQLAFHALKSGGSAATILNAANEVAVASFLERKIGFREIDQLIDRVLNRLPSTVMEDCESVLMQDQAARNLAKEYIGL